jgi:hypothetical protein
MYCPDQVSANTCSRDPVIAPLARQARNHIKLRLRPQLTPQNHELLPQLPKSIRPMAGGFTKKGGRGGARGGGKFTKKRSYDDDDTPRYSKKVKADEEEEEEEAGDFIPELKKESNGDHYISVSFFPLNWLR